MMKLLRKHRHWLMIVIAILAIPFVFYFVQRPDYGAIRSDQFARVYDRNVSMIEAQQTVRLLNLAQALGMSDFVQSLTVGAGQNQNQVYAQFILNLLVLRHEAARLGIRPSAPEIADCVRPSLSADWVKLLPSAISTKDRSNSGSRPCWVSMVINMADAIHQFNSFY